jgi:hypothetical protein
MEGSEVLLRLGPGVRDEVRKAAESAGLSMAEWLREAVAEKLSSGGSPSSAGREAVVRQLMGTLAKIDAGFVLVPGSEVPGTAWDQILRGEGPA